MLNTNNDNEELERLRKELEPERKLRRKAELEVEYWKKRYAKNFEVIGRAKNINPVKKFSTHSITFLGLWLLH